MDSARALVARGKRLTVVSQSLGVSRAQLSVHVHRSPDWRDGRKAAHPVNDPELVERIRRAVAELPTYGYRRVWAPLRLESEAEGLAPVNAKRVYRVMRDNHLLLGRKPAGAEWICPHISRRFFPPKCQSAFHIRLRCPHWDF